jgi:hypothetical protein
MDEIYELLNQLEVKIMNIEPSEVDEESIEILQSKIENISNIIYERFDEEIGDFEELDDYVQDFTSENFSNVKNFRNFSKK